MPLGIVSDKDFESELSNSGVGHIQTPNKEEDSEQRPSNLNHANPTDEIPDNPITTSDVLQMKSVGRLPDVNNVPQSLRKILGETVVTEGLASAKQLVSSLVPNGISQPTLSTYATGNISRGEHESKEAEDLRQYVNGRKTKISKKALNRLNLAVSLLDEQKLLGCNAETLTNVAKGMAQVVKHMEPSENKSEEKKDPVQFHFYAPQVRNENHYDVVVAKDNY